GEARGPGSLARRMWPTRLSERSWRPTSEGFDRGGPCKKSATAAWKGSVHLRIQAPEKERCRTSRSGVGGERGLRGRRSPNRRGQVPRKRACNHPIPPLE